MWNKINTLSKTQQEETKNNKERDKKFQELLKEHQKLAKNYNALYQLVNRKIQPLQTGGLLNEGDNLVEIFDKVNPWRYLMIKNVKVKESNEFALIEEGMSCEIVEVWGEGLWVNIPLKTKIDGETPVAKVSVDLILIPN